MDATAIPGAWKKPLWQGLAIAALWGLAYMFAPLAPFLALALPLFVCPAFAQGRAWFALLMPLAPATAYFAAGGDTALSLLIPLCPYLCLLVQALGRRYRLDLHAETAAYAAAFAAGAVGMLLRLGVMLGGPLFTQLADTAVNAVQQSVTGGNLLYKLVSLGYLTVPDAYADTAAIQLGNLILIAPSLRRELLNMLRLRLTEGLTGWIPSLLVQGAILVGLFSALRTERVRARKAGDAPPRFAALRLTRGEQGAMLVLCVATLLTAFSDDAFLSLLSSLTYAGFSTVYQLLGAAVLITLLSARHPERAALYGLIAALLYLVFSVGLFMLGVVDQSIHLRDAGPNMPKEE